MNLGSIKTPLKPAEYWIQGAEGRIECRLCPHRCRLGEGQSGLCRVRVVQGGELKAAGYGLISSVHVDPVEKKPLYHFFPGAPIFSIGGWGCNFGCVFCQNWSISQKGAQDGPRSLPGEMMPLAKQRGCSMVAYTYNEPLVGFEYVRDCSRKAHEAGIKNVLVTNGYIETKPAAELLPLTDALNVDIKSIEESFYRRQCRGTLAPVLRFCEQAVKAGCHLELTNLIVPSLNESESQVEALASWIEEHLGRLIPLHLSAYHPDYQASQESTPAATLIKAQEICRRHLSYVYIGNVMSRKGQDTLCPGCENNLVQRQGYSVKQVGISAGACARCGRKADFILA